jgi:hypothetical protein
MPVIYKLGKKNNEINENGFRIPNLFTELEDHVEINGRSYNKNSLVEELNTKMTRLSYYDSKNKNAINTNTRSYSYGQDFRNIGGTNSFRNGDTILTNQIKFDDGTEIIATENSGNTRGSIVQYRNGEIVNSRSLVNSLTRIQLVKMSEGTFIAFVNNSTNMSYGKNYISTNSSAQESINTDSYGESSVNRDSTTFNSTFLNYHDNSGTSYSSLTTSSVADTVDHTTRIILFDKNLNIIKENTCNEFDNVLGVTDDGGIIFTDLYYTYGYISSSPVLGSYLRIRYLSGDLVMTTLSTSGLHLSNSNAYLSNLIALLSTNSYFDKESNTLYFLQATDKFKITAYEIDFSRNIASLNSSKGIDLSSIYSENSFYPYGYPSYGFKQYKLQLGSIVENGKRYFYIIPSLSNSLRVFYNYSWNSTSTTYYNAMFRLSYLAKNIDKNQYPLYLVDETGTIMDKVPMSNLGVDGPRATFPVGDNFVLVVKDDLLTLYKVENGKFTIAESISKPIYSVGVDSLERIWYVGREEGSDLEMISPYLSLNVDITFEDEKLTYVDSEIETAVSVSASDLTGQLKSLEIQLVIEGNAIFRETGNKRITVTTNETQPLRVPFVVVGSGAINMFVTSEE